ncbi:conjugal transfer protein TraG [Ectothiorhodospira haloalkaliphila]|uniref:Conjugal transfer protein TraG n=1 Tax=Ectothiorhodospira haloalkaliphila TaxID=421628 RepID=W8KX86_9GAMM|nr:conjugal transfer protein TraG N-terminal domain-containing protein [Ectothiorhodospira haloalkaliphila]AHK80131.1 conjugal transfer protein TraG [Ectothiorhodospira haloalkaliphila]
MGVDSYLELFTTLYGWQLYNNIWGILMATGLVFIPFIVILIRNFVSVNTSMEANAGSAALVRRMEIDIVLALTVVVLAGQPAINLHMNDLSFTPPATLDNPAPTAVDPSSTGTTFGHPDGGFTGAPSSVPVPVWWYGVMALSSGINQAIITGFPATNELREIERAMRSLYIEDANLRHEVNQFYSRCYVPARSKFQRDQPSAAAPILANQGRDDPDWIGSHVYRQLPGYYDSLNAGNPVPGFPVDMSRETDQYWMDTSGSLSHGIPTCQQWWEDASHGLRQRLLEDNSRTQRVVTWVQSRFPGLTVEERQDTLARNILEQAPQSYVDSVASLRERDTGGMDLPGPLSFSVLGMVGSGNELFTQGVSAIGLVSFYTLFMEPTLALILQALPFIQALTLMGIYAMLPLVLLFGMYQPSILLVGAIAIFTVKFWAVLWHITLWVDNNLLQSLYTGTSLLERVGPDLKSILLTTIIAGLYLGLPVIWSAMMGWVGFKAVGAINSATSELSSSSKQAGQQGGNLANRVATKGKGR